MPKTTTGLSKEKINEYLQRAYEVLSVNGHCKGVYATYQDGRSCNPTSEYAVCYCLTGVIMAVCRSPLISDQVLNQVNETTQKLYDCYAVHFNDSLRTTKEDVLQLLREAMK